MTFLYALATLWPKFKHNRSKIYTKIFKPAVKGHRLVYVRQAFLTIIFCFIMFSYFRAQSQDHLGVGARAADIKPLEIGQTVPDLTLTNLHGYKDIHGKPSATAKLSDFKGKLLILDFWATWCSPCVAMIPKMDSLQKAFDDRVQFLSITYQNEKEVLPFLEKFEKQRDRHFDIPVMTGDTELNKLFPHVYLPHYVWIDGNGVVRAITEAFYISGDNISNLLKTGNIDARMKADVPITIDKTKPLFYTERPYVGHGFKQSTFSGYIDGTSRGYWQNIYGSDTVPIKRFTARNLTIPALYRAAYQKQRNETILEVKDPSKLTLETSISSEFLDWLRQGNAFCYELVLDSALADKGYQYMKEDLQNYFPQYSASIESRKMKCLTLIRTSDIDKLHTKGGKPNVQIDRFGAKFTSCYLFVFMGRMKYYLQNSLPLVDETGYTEMVDLELATNMSNLEELNSALAKYDLKLVEKDSYIDALIIKDRNPQPNQKTL